MKKRNHFLEKSKLTTAQLVAQLNILKSDLNDSRIKIQLQKFTKPHKINELRQQIAQINTIISQRIIKESNEAKTKRSN
ncbi:50S ribosomal protein L29 [Candidatus Berkelbacteria bacterium CG_4_9_14_3_um_filter_39_23]|uniref:Large ribosomal subunit protein uL29 n=2 Tax=Candidatus Berkelbacteria TaxID=1618330 RepID=A0A2M7CJ62_9BACT|nr:50S ribosomal protein L29 [Candidatus Berkelbacteria bacterium]OIP06183.1 MAG: 50S ribosomal protein L29 [Candidatus Berkelbacteria bacterium CG2_30_39_44]PIR28093.1 MAG: 50S ribosomal protein L29 [Candidatus Berkelbacteria bacterium CG11_big_fil_rev_8_21_14_0_20_40_23]PIV25669.1 MAG: 50S ribosomal protein L29 [Candidatus Berkelbacteria bacterium CG03_land_8_20_14_0_80_40_36]PIX30725.1 MAG: 50S ribosomal protein L29 [Candidatus Berkelbacteria bacterium CG_4_8_14_3_um_filter_39_27]PIZ28889.1